MWTDPKMFWLLVIKFCLLQGYVVLGYLLNFIKMYKIMLLAKG